MLNSNSYSKIREAFIESILQRLDELSEDKNKKSQAIKITKDLIALGKKLGIEPDEELENFADGKIEESLLDEGKIWDKIKKYAKKILLPAAVLGTLISLSNSASAEGLSVTGNATEGIKCEYTHNLTGKDLASCDIRMISLGHSLESSENSLSGSLDITKLVNHDNVSIHINTSDTTQSKSINNATTEEAYKFLAQSIPGLSENFSLDEFKTALNNLESAPQVKKLQNSFNNAVDKDLISRVEDDGSTIDNALSQGNQASAMLQALNSGDIESVKHVVKKGVSLDKPLEDGMSPLAYAALYTDNGVQMVKDMIDLGADVNAKDKHGRSVLKIIELESGVHDGLKPIIKFLKDHGAKA